MLINLEMIPLVSDHKENSGINKEITEPHSEPCQISNMGRFAKIVNGL